VLERLGTEDVPRMRIGIRTERAEKVPADAYVLEKFGEEEEKALEKVLSRAAEALGAIIGEGIERAMNRYN
jgi:PTH1 family peptidyl-tRNA hydrolase